MTPMTMFEKIWNRHVVADEEGEILLYVDRAFVHEAHMHVFAALNRQKLGVLRPRQAFAFSDHYVPTTGRANGVDAMPVAEMRNMVLQQQIDTKKHGIALFGFHDPRQGILHVVPPEQGITQPGMLIGGGDSHTSTHGAFGCLAFGMGISDMAHVLGTQMTWQRKPKTLRIRVDGELGFGVAAKDVILTIIAKIGVGGGAGHVIEYAGSTFSTMSMEARMTVCNMSIEAGARAGMMALDDTTFEYMEGRPYAPQGENWRIALDHWRKLPSDPEATFDREVALDAQAMAPMVTWGTNPEQAAAIIGAVPNPRDVEDEELRAAYAAALEYMGLAPGMELTDIAVDRVFIG